MEEAFSIFELRKGELLNGIYVNCLEEEIKQLIFSSGGPARACNLLKVKYTRLKEGPSEKILEESTIKSNVEDKTNAKEIYLSCRYSPHKIRFPKRATEELAYLIGVILGDGCLAGRNRNYFK